MPPKTPASLKTAGISPRRTCNGFFEASSMIKPAQLEEAVAKPKLENPDTLQSTFDGEMAEVFSSSKLSVPDDCKKIEEAGIKFVHDTREILSLKEKNLKLDKETYLRPISNGKETYNVTFDFVMK
jgi:hypothetical protein